MKLNDINHSMAVASSKFIGFWEGLRILANGLISERFSNQKRCNWSKGFKNCEGVFWIPGVVISLLFFQQGDCQTPLHPAELESTKPDTPISGSYVRGHNIMSTRATAK